MSERTRRNGRFSIAAVAGCVLAVGALAVWGGLAASSAGASVSKAPYVAQTSQPDRLSQMTPVADGIQRIGSTQFSSTYGGEVLQPDGSINVYAVGGATPALSAALQPAVAAGAQLHYVSVAHSFASLEALTTQIAKAPLTVDGASLVSWFPDIATSKVDITLNGYDIRRCASS